jgi:hypothetical protein
MSSDTGPGGACGVPAGGGRPARDTAREAGQRATQLWYAAARGWPATRDDEGAVWLAVGTEFDLLDVPEAAGRRALRRLLGYRQAALDPGPVALLAPGRCGFFVAPGAAEDLPELLDWLDWGGIELGIRALGPGDAVRAPEPERWLHGRLAAPPEVIALLAAIAEACWRHLLADRRAGVRVPAPRPEADGDA